MTSQNSQTNQEQFLNNPGQLNPLITSAFLLPCDDYSMTIMVAGRQASEEEPSNRVQVRPNAPSTITITIKIATGQTCHKRKSSGAESSYYKKSVEPRRPFCRGALWRRPHAGSFCLLPPPNFPFSPKYPSLTPRVGPTPPQVFISADPRCRLSHLFTHTRTKKNPFVLAFDSLTLSFSKLFVFCSRQALLLSELLLCIERDWILRGICFFG